MFHCERCKSSFNPSVAATAFSCPRCRGRDGVESPLHFRLFEASAPPVANAELELERERRDEATPTVE